MHSSSHNLEHFLFIMSQDPVVGDEISFKKTSRMEKNVESKQNKFPMDFDYYIGLRKIFFSLLEILEISFLQ